MSALSTPGPWAVSEAFQSASITSSRHLTSIATVRFPSGSSIGETEAFANLRLIAASPDLFVALEQMMRLRSPDLLTNVDRAEIINGAINALAKARGESA